MTNYDKHLKRKLKDKAFKRAYKWECLKLKLMYRLRQLLNPPKEE